MTLYSVLLSRRPHVATSIGLLSRRLTTRGIASHHVPNERLPRGKYNHRQSCICNRYHQSLFSSLSTSNDKQDDGSKGEDEVEISWANDDGNYAVTEDVEPSLPLFTIDTSSIESNDTEAPLDVPSSFESSPPLVDVDTRSIDYNVGAAAGASSSFESSTPLFTINAQSNETNDLAMGAEADESSSDLSDLLFSDNIFEESWQGKTIINTSQAIGDVPGKPRPAKFGMFNTDMFSSSHSAKPKKDVSNTPIENPSTAIEKRYNDLLQQTNNLLDAITDTDSSSTSLQLMDFDKVMHQWAQFQSEVDSSKENKSDSYTERTKGTGLYDFSLDLLETNHQNVMDQDLKLRASDNCMRLLHTLEKNYDNAYQGVASQSKIFPNAATFNHALYTLAHSAKGAMCGQEAYFILDRMFQRCRQYRDSAATSKIAAPPEPSIITYNSVIHAIAKSGASNAGFLAEDVFDKMEMWKKECDDRDEGGIRLYHGVYPNSRTLASLLDAWANAENVNGSSLVRERTTSILEAALDNRRSYVRRVKNVSDEAGVHNNHTHEDDEADELLAFVESAKEEKMIDGDIVEETINEDIFGNVLASSEPEPSAVEPAAFNLATTSAAVTTAAAKPFLKPNIVAVNTVLNAWSLWGLGYDEATRAHDLLNKVEHLYESGDLDLPLGYQDPTVSPLDGHDDKLESLKPNVRSYATIMNVWANVVSVDSHRGEEAATKCEQILTKMENRGTEDVSIRPNLVAYTTCISAWARADCTKAPAKAEHILNKLIDLYYDEGVSELPTLEGALANAQHDAPFNAVITAYARSGDSSAPDRTLAILDRLEASPIQPTAITYNAVIDVCAKRGEPDRAIALLERMKQRSIRPDPTSYDTIINAFARDETPGSADKAWEFFQRLEEETRNGQSYFVATKFSYSSVLNSYARASGKSDGGFHVAEKAKKVYDHMIQQIEEGKLLGNSDAYANSCLLNCCANVNGPSTEKRAALIMAINAFEELKRNPSVHGEPNQFTFGTMMKCSSRLSSDPDEKTRLMENLFTQACNRGYLSSSVLGQFLKNTPSHVSAKAILAQGGTKRDLPEKWYRYVPEKHRPRGASGPRRTGGYQQQRRFAS